MLLNQCKIKNLRVLKPLTESLLLGDEGFTDKLVATHIKEVKKARAASVKEPTWEDTIQRYQLGRAIAQGRK